MRSIWLAGLCFLVAVIGASPRCESLADWMNLCWEIDGEYITFQVDATSPGWVGLGISDNGGMKGADLAVLEMERGEWSIRDYFSTAFSFPTIDASQDTELISVNADGEVIQFSFRRPITPCDKEQDFAFTDTKQWFIFARGTTTTLGYHGTESRGTASINFLAPAPTADSTATETLMTVEMKMPSYQVPTSQTNYVCSKHQLVASEKVQIFKVEPIIDNPSVVHHMIAYQCISELPQDGVFECTMVPEECSRFYVGWGVGQMSYEFPTEAGLPFGTGFSTYYILQVHYNNAANTAGLVDNSGFKLHYSNNLRPNDVGMFIVGYLESQISIPPGTKSYQLTAQCPSGCTNKIPDEGVTLMFNGLHMHQIGSRIGTRIVRDGAVVAEIGHMDYYDFNHQNPTQLPPNVKLLPGDSIIHFCDWDSSSRTTTTKGGEESTDEMCYAFLDHYPAMDLTGCFSSDTGAICEVSSGQSTPEYSMVPLDDPSINELQPAPTPCTAASTTPAAPPPPPPPPAEPDYGYHDYDYDYDQDCKGFEGCKELAPWFKVYWSKVNVSGVPSVRIRVEAESDGWVGFGLSDNGGMKGADVAILNTTADGSDFLLTDRFTTKFDTPVEDQQQDCRLISAERANGVTTYEYTRPIRSCDPMDLDILDHSQWVIFAVGVSDRFTVHIKRGTSQISFLTAPAELPPIPEDAGTMTIQMPEHELSSKATDYQCKTFEMPRDTRYQVVSWNAVVDSPLVHHIVVWACGVNPDMGDGLWECGTMPEGCEEFLFGWAPGVKGDVYPSDAGFPYGKGEHPYWVLQMHYNNPHGLLGGHDSSAVVFRTTTELRPKNVGVLWFVNGFPDSIPPKQSAYKLDTLECPRECMQTLPAEGITVFNEFQHMHQAGSAMATYQVRDGKEMVPLGDIAYYDFNFQGAQYPPPGRRIMPNDRLLLSCTYNTMDRKNNTEGGLSSLEEMCMNFITVIPRPELAVCGGSVKKKTNTTIGFCITRGDNGVLTTSDAYTVNPTPYIAYEEPACVAPSNPVDLSATEQPISGGGGGGDGNTSSGGAIIMVIAGASVMVIAVAAITYLLQRADRSTPTTPAGGV